MNKNPLIFIGLYEFPLCTFLFALAELFSLGKISHRSTDGYHCFFCLMLRNLLWHLHDASREAAEAAGGLPSLWCITGGSWGSRRSAVPVMQHGGQLRKQAVCRPCDASRGAAEATGGLPSLWCITAVQLSEDEWSLKYFSACKKTKYFVLHAPIWMI